MGNIYKIAAAASSALVFAWLAASPYLAVSDFKRALEHGDTDAIREAVDFPRLREDLRAKMLHQFSESIGPEMRGNPGVTLGIMLGTPMLNDTVDSLVTPQHLITSAQNHLWDDSSPVFASISGLSGIMTADKESPALYSTRYRSWERFTVRYPLTRARPTEIVEVVWLRSGLATWQVTSVEVTLENGSISLSKDQQLPALAGQVVAPVRATIENDSYDIRHLRWGMSVAQVAAVEPEAGPSEGDPQVLLIDDSVAGIPVTASLICDEKNGLNSSLVLPKVRTPETLVATFRALYDDFSRKYGTGRIVHSQDRNDGQEATPEEVGVRLNQFVRDGILFAVQYPATSRTTIYVGVMNNAKHGEYAYVLFDSRLVHP